MDIAKQIACWRDGSEQDFEVAGELMIANGRLSHGLFFAHLAVEKMLKAHVAKATRQVPPKSHNLVRLAELGQVGPSEEQDDFFRRLNAYQLEGRYPESFMDVPVTVESTRSIQVGAKEAMAWLKKAL